MWIEKSEQDRKLLPAYYKNFDTLKEEVRLALDNIKKKDYNAALPHVAYVS